MIEFITHVEPEANIPSKNQDTIGETPKDWFTGEYKKIPKKNPTQTGVHIIHDNIPFRKSKKSVK